MPVKQIVGVLCVGILCVGGMSFGQIEGVGFSLETLPSGQNMYSLFVSGEGEMRKEVSTMTGESGQTMTGVDSGVFVALSLGYPFTDIVLLSGEKTSNLELGVHTGEIPVGGNSGFVSHLIISEVYYDGTDERIEITNIGEENFLGNVTLLGAKSTPLSLTNISILSGESKIFGDSLVQISGSTFIDKTGLALSMTDTTAILLQLIISGQLEDSFVVDQYRVNKYNDKKTSFEKIGTTPTWVQTGRVFNANSGYIINPGIYFATGTNLVDVSIPLEPSGTHLQIPISCDSLDQRDLIKINEIFPGNEKYPPYVELAIHENITIDSLSISGDLLITGLEFLWLSGGTTLEKNALLILAATGLWQGEGINTIQNTDFSLGSTGNWLLITIGSGQNRRVMDIIYLSGKMLGKSSYFNTTTYQCVRIMDVLDDFSPGFEQKFLKYFPVTTVTKIEYIETGTGNQSGTGACPLPSPNPLLSGNTQVVTDISSIVNEYTIRIMNVDYDPDGADTNNEKITLLASNVSGNQAPLDLSKVFRLKVNGTTKTLPWILPMNTPTTFVKTFGFPNSTTSGADVVIQLTYGDHIFDTYTYNPKKLSSQEETALTSTGYTVSSVLDGDTFRIKYQGKTQSIRLLGIDAPESTKTRYKYLECFGVEAKNYLKSLIDKKKITFQFDPTQDQKDIYDRLLAYVFLDDENINQTMIENGYAKEYTYKTAYRYQSQFKQAEQSAQDQGAGLWNESTCGVSLSGAQLSGGLQTTGVILALSGLQFTITYVLPNPKGSDTAEELGLFINAGTGGRENKQTNTSPYQGRKIENGTGEYIDLSQGFSLRIGKSKKKIQGIVHMGQENILSGSLGLVNKAACVSLLYEEQELTKFCYGKPKEGQKIYASDQGLTETPQENLDILNLLQLKKIGNQLCVYYKEQSFLCKRIPASKAEIKATQEQKLYKGFASLIKQYILKNWKGLYYNTPLKGYFDLVAQNKKLIASGVSYVDIYGQSIAITDMKEQLKVLETTLPGIVALFIGINGL